MDLKKLLTRSTTASFTMGEAGFNLKDKVNIPSDKAEKIIRDIETVIRKNASDETFN